MDWPGHREKNDDDETDGGAGVAPYARPVGTGRAGGSRAVLPCSGQRAAQVSDAIDSAQSMWPSKPSDSAIARYRLTKSR